MRLSQAVSGPDTDAQGHVSMSRPYALRSPAVLAFRRRELERWVEVAIALLDALDGDPDLEADEGEDTGEL